MQTVAVHIPRDVAATLLERAANERYIERTAGTLRSRRSRGFTSGAGHVAGADAGRRADLTPGRKLGS